MHLTSIIELLLGRVERSARVLDRSRFVRRGRAGLANCFGDAIGQTNGSDLMGFPDQMQRPHLPLESAQQLSAVVLVGEEGVHDLAELSVAIGGDGIS